MTDPTRATFVQNKYRFATAQDPVIKARFASAQELVIETHLNGAAAEALAAKYLAGTGSPELVFTIEVEELVTIDDFAGAPPRYRLISQLYAFDREVRVIDIKSDPFAQRSLITVRG